ncbi:MAG: NAD(P)H-binding protein [Candidatus Latescibacteria bacterium]|nr:NAD(P)H-binding protein [Candidatus Latescibacterota bacterium]
MKVIVIGANGNTATRVVRLLQESDKHEPVAMIRNADQRAKFDELGVATVLADLEYPIDHAIAGCDGVIFAAGSGGHTGKDKTVLVDHIGAIRSMVTAQVHGATRYVMLSALNADENSTSKMAHYHKAKAKADRHLMESDLDWTVICPGGLRDDEGNGRVSVRPETCLEGITSRDNLAAALVACLDLDNTIRKRFSLLEGETPIMDALHRA